MLETLVEAYEKVYHPIDPPSPIEAIKFRMDQGQFTRSQLTRVLGGRSKVTEVLNKRRALSKAMIVLLHLEFSIPYESLLSDIERTQRVPKRRPSRAKPHSRLKTAS